MALTAQCKVYIAFADGPLVAAPTWTEVTSDVRKVDVQRGRSNELDDFQAGRATIVLNNRGRKYDPDYTAGPNYPNVKVRRQIKIEAVYSAVTYPIFRGHVTSWVQDWPGYGKDAVCGVQCADIFGLLASWQLPVSAHDMYAIELAPTTWWRLDDDTATMLDTQGLSTGLYTGIREQVDPIILGGTHASRVNHLAADITSPAIGVASLVLTGSTLTSFALTILVPDASSGSALILTQSLGNSLELFISKGVAQFQTSTAANTASVYSSGSIADLRVHHVAAVRNGTTVELYIDGVSQGTATNGAMTGSLDPVVGTIMATTAVASVDATLEGILLFQGTALTAAQALALAGAALTGWAGDIADARITRLLDLLGVPAGLYSVATASSSVGQFEGGGDALSYLQGCTRSDQGRLFASRDGKVTFHPKTTSMGAASVATFADDGTGVKYSGFGLEYDDRLIYNKVTVRGAAQVEFTAENLTSQATYSVRSLQIDTALPSVEACRDVAQNLVARYSDPQTRGKEWLVHPQRDLAYATVLGRELGDVVTIKRSPPVGAAVSKTVQVTQIRHEVDVGKGIWNVTFAGAPAYTTAAFRWGTSNWGGSDGWS